MKRLVVPAVVVAILAVLLWYARTSDRTATLAPTDAAPAAPPEAPSIVAPAPEPDSARVAAPTPTSTAEAPADGAAPKAAAAPDLAELRGRFLLPGGAPAAGVALGLGGWQANSERVQKFGLPKEWNELKTASGADGTFSFRFDPPRAFQFTVDAKLAGYAKVSWRWSELPPSEVTDVGDVTLVRGGAIRGRIVDNAGRVPAGEWQIYVDTEYQPQGPGADSTTLYAPPASATGEFLFEDVPPGSARLKAYSRIASWIPGPTVKVTDGQTSEANIVYEGPDNSRRITVVVFSRPFHIFSRVEAGSLKLRGPGGIERVAKQMENSSQSWCFDDLEPGSYSIEFEDPRFEPWSRVGVEPGQSVNAMLAGASAVRLAVVDAATDEPIGAYRLRVQFRFTSGVHWYPDTFEVVGADAAPPADGLFTGMIPTDQTWIVEATDSAPCRVEVDALAPGETRSIVAKMSRGASLEGVVVDADGTPARGVGVLVRRNPKPEDEGDLESFAANDLDARETSTDDAGRFSFRALAPQRYLVRASRSHLIRADATLDIGVESVTTRLTLPGSGSLAARILAPASASFAGWRAIAWPKASDSSWPGEVPPAAPVANVEATGAFRIDGLTAGDFDVFAMHGESSFAIGEARIAVERTTDATFDLGEHFPGELDVAVTIDGEAPAGCWVTARPVDDVYSLENVNVRAQTGADGVAHLTWLRAGEWKLFVNPGQGEWTYPAPDVVRVPPAGAARAAIAVNLTSGELLVLDAQDGRPLANQAVSIHGAESRSRASARTDANGRVRFRVPEGRYRVLGGGRATRPVVDAPEVEWTSAGPKPAEVRLPGAQ